MKGGTGKELRHEPCMVGLKAATFCGIAAYKKLFQSVYIHRDSTAKLTTLR